MGWCSGAEIADDLWKMVEKHIAPSKRQQLARDWVDFFESHDCDCMMETDVGNVAGKIEDKDGGMQWAWDSKMST